MTKTLLELFMREIFLNARPPSVCSDKRRRSLRLLLPADSHLEKSQKKGSRWGEEHLVSSEVYTDRKREGWEIYTEQGPRYGPVLLLLQALGKVSGDMPLLGSLAFRA